MSDEAAPRSQSPDARSAAARPAAATLPPVTRTLSLEELEHRLSGLEKLLDVTRHLAADIETTRVLETITRGACEALDCDRASLYQYDPERGELYTRVVTELEIAEIRRGLGEGISGDVARSRQLANVPSAADDARWDRSVDQATGYVTRNLLAAPLVSPTDDNLLGVLEAINKRGARFDRFDEELIGAFSRHASVALDRVRLIEELRRRQEIEVSLNVARDIQRAFMPSRLPQPTGYEIATWWFPNQAIGGDYCDVFPLKNGRLALVIADVSGHGIGPSLIMASVRAALRALALEHSSPATLVARLAQAMAADLQTERFITLVLAVIDPLTHRLEYANAGHGPALHYGAREGRFEVLDATGLPLCVGDDHAHECPPARLIEVGDLVVLATDGIVEAQNHADEAFGRARLEEVVAQHDREPVAELVRRIGRAVESHYVGDHPQDDLTVLVARRNA